MNKQRIAVISDTHNSLPRLLVDRLRKSDEIWHLGDVCELRTIEPLAALAKPLHVVAGNCDPRYIWPDQLELSRAGLRFRLEHRPPRTASSGYDAILHGHLHQPIAADWQGIRVLSPGAISGPRNGSASCFAWLLIEEDGQWNWEVEAL